MKMRAKTFLLMSCMMSAAPLAHAAETPPIPMVEVSGSATMERDYDLAVLEASLQSEAANSKLALEDLRKKLPGLLDAIKKAGIPEADSVTYGPSMQILYANVHEDRGGQVFDRQKQTGVRASYSISVKVRKLDQVASIFDALGQAGAIISAPRYELVDETKFDVELGEQAIHTAMEHARRLINAADSKPGRVLLISDPEAMERRPSAMPAPRLMAMAASAPPQPEFPIVPPKAKRSRTIVVQMEILPK